MANLAGMAAGQHLAPGDLFGLLADAGTHTFAIPTQGYAPSAVPGDPPDPQGGGGGDTGGGSGSGGGGVGTPGGGAPPGAQGPTSGNGTKGGKGGNGGGGGPAPSGQYDVSSDPVLQQVNAAMALADQNAQAAALRQRQQAAVAYGDPALASQLFGASDPYVQAAGQNQEGTVEQLLRAYQSGLHNFDTGLDPSLAYSGYRVGQEGEIGQGYQDNLAQAAAQIQAQLGGYTDTLNNTLEADQQQRIQALADAYNRAVQNALTNPPAGGGKKKKGKG